MTSRKLPARRLVLVDASSYLYRAFHAMPDLRNSHNEPTGAVYGVINMLRTLRDEYHPAALAMVFDAPGPTFRDHLYADYKATRTAMPDDLSAQIAPLHALITALGVPLLAVPGVEADDVIGTLATRAVDAGYTVVISTGDKDLAQLVGPHVTLINTMTHVVLDSAGVVARYGVPPARIADLLALTGDKVDNVPGVPGVGPKTAVRWLTTYGSLAALLAHVADIPGRAGAALAAAAPTLALSRQLVTIDCQVALDVDPDALIARPPDRAAVRRLYQRLEFKTWLAELGDDDAAPPPPPAAITDPSQVASFCATARAAPVLAVALGTDDDGHECLVLGIAMATLAVALAPAVVQEVAPLLAVGGPPLLVHDGKRLIHGLARYGVALAPPVDDLLLAAYVLDSGAAHYDLATLALKYLGTSLATGPWPAAAAARAAAMLALQAVLQSRLAALARVDAIYREIELPLVAVLARIEAHGVPIDGAMLAAQSAEFADTLAALEVRAHALAGTPFNLNSPAQIQQVLFHDLKLPVRRRTPKGQPSTAEEVLTELAIDYPLPQLILDYRSIGKLKSTYTDKLPALCDATTGRVHTTYHQAVAATGRLSSSDPNLQNIPIRTEEGRRVRRAFIAAPGFRLLSADYSQIELRLMAHLSQDEGLVRAFQEGRDIHQATAAEVFAVTLAAVSDDQRRAAKAINFGLMYGMSAFGLARQLRISQAAAQAYCDRYFARYPGVQAYMDKTRAIARRDGYVETLFGRRLYVPDIKASNSARRQYAERTAINAPLQGTAADLIKMAMLRIDTFLQENALESRMIMQVHDELVFEVPPAEETRLQDAVIAAMTGVVTLSVPLVVDCGLGSNWADAH
ncbi:MAG: DNA polymerase I [Acidiferrobacter sp.]